MLEQLIEYYNNGNKSQFSKRLGITPQGISTWLVRNTFDSELIFSKCENVNAEWLLTGEGSMLKEKQPEEKTVANVVDTSYIYNMYKDYRNMQAEKDIEIKELHAKIEKQNDTIITLIAEKKELEARLDVLDPLQLPPVGDVFQKKSLSSQIQPIASVPVRTGKRKSSKI